MTNAAGLVITTDAARVVQLATAVAGQDPVRYTVFGTLPEWVQREDAAPWAAYPSDSPLVLAARSQPTTPVAVTDGWPAPEILASALAALNPALAALAGPTPMVDAIVAMLGRTVTQRIEERLFRLDELLEPAGVPGRARLATPQDAGLLEVWITDFFREAFGRPPPFSVADRLARTFDVEPVWLWLDADGEPCSFAARRPSVYGAARIGPVYTPPEARGQGYGSAVTAAIASDILDCGAIPCLFTDLANPTSNKIYQAIGFTPVEDRVQVRFD